jgi:hypothetical protein
MISIYAYITTEKIIALPEVLYKRHVGLYTCRSLLFFVVRSPYLFYLLTVGVEVSFFFTIYKCSIILNPYLMGSKSHKKCEYLKAY